MIDFTWWGIGTRARGVLTSYPTRIDEVENKAVCGHTTYFQADKSRPEHTALALYVHGHFAIRAQQGAAVLLALFLRDLEKASSMEFPQNSHHLFRPSKRERLNSIWHLALDSAKKFGMIYFKLSPTRSFVKKWKTFD